MMDDDRCMIRHTLVKIDDVVVQEAHAARRNGFPDGLPFGIAVKTIERVLPVLKYIQCPRAERVLHAGVHASIGNRIFFQFRLTGYHFRRRLPSWPMLAPVDRAPALPGKSVPPNADAVTYGRAVLLDQIEETARRIDDDRPCCFSCWVWNTLAIELWIDLPIWDGSYQMAAVLKCRIRSVKLGIGSALGRKCCRRCELVTSCIGLRGGRAAGKCGRCGQ
ncbi:hypothetical protein AGR7B_Lc60025 [Agrobacterium deltaense RV3]|nr:hypothetical protein AGR7B_Lc60025 [Agrobacterium deltaense RV3]